MSDPIPHGEALPDDVLTLEQVTDIRRRLNFEHHPWIRNVHRCLDGVVQEHAQGTGVDPDHVRQDTAGALRAVENAIGELQVVAATLRPLTVVEEEAA